MAAALTLAAASLLFSPRPADSQAGASRCAVESVHGLRFDGYDVFDPNPADASGLLVIECTGVDPRGQVLIELGRGQQQSFAHRVLRAGSHQLRYNLYLDAARTLVWGDGTSGTSVMRVRPPEGRALSIPIFGRIPARQQVAAGAYSDELLLTLEY